MACSPPRSFATQPASAERSRSKCWNSSTRWASRSVSAMRARCARTSSPYSARRSCPQTRLTLQSPRRTSRPQRQGRHCGRRIRSKAEIALKETAVAQETYDVLVIGEGMSGLSAAHALAQSGLRTATLEAQLFGGLVLNVNELEPAPDPSRTVSGAEIASELMQANADLGVTSIQEAVTAIQDAGATKQVTTAALTYQARQVVLASGARLKRLGVPGEAEFEGRGVSQCADCDGPMYQNENVV